MSIRRRRADAGGEIWHGRLEVIPTSADSCLSPARGAYVNAIARAKDIADFRRRTNASATLLGLRVVSAVDIQPASWSLAAGRLDPSLVDLVKEVERTGEVCWGTFHAWEDGPG